MSAPAPASIFAVELLGEFIRRGIREVVVCPGSRSQALALAAAAAERAGALRLHVRLDERSAAFFALGVARETGLPAPVVVTSGTAVANLAPAVLEAHEGRVPLILLTADRPAELRGIRSNQTTRQVGIFGAAARFARDIPAPEYGPDGGLRRSDGRDPGALAEAALAAAVGLPGGAPAGPAHLNLAFREPLSGTAGFDRMIGNGFSAAAQEGAAAASGAPASPSAGPEASGGSAWRRPARAADPGRQGYVHAGDALAVVIAGEGAGPEAESFAHAAGLPLLAEVVSGARYGREAVTAYASLIDEPSVGGLVERAVVFGHPTLTRQVPALLRRDDVEVIVVDPYADAEHYDPGGDARVVPSATVADGYDPAAMRRWLGAWVTADRELQRERSTVHAPDTEAARAPGYRERSAYARAEVAAMREPIGRELLAESLWRASWPHDRLMLAASRMVRSLDALAPARRVEVRSNRGLAGIDGTLATALGVASASQGGDDPARAAGTTRLLIGDLALLHDAGSLLLPEGEPAPRIQVFVANDGGGTIFDSLEVAASADPQDFTRVMTTPQRVGFASLAEAYGWEHRRIETRGELERLLTAPVTGPMLVEVPLAR